MTHNDEKTGTEIPTIWLFNIAMENGPFIEVYNGLPIKNGDFPRLC